VCFSLLQACVTNEEAEEAFTQLQVPLSSAYAWAMPPLLQPLVVAGLFGSGKRAVLQRLVALLPQVLAVPKVVTSKPHVPGKDEGGHPRQQHHTFFHNGLTISGTQDMQAWACARTRL